MANGLLSKLLDGFLSLLFPPRCEVCGTLQEPVFCSRCRKEVRAINTPYCSCCGVPFDPLGYTPDCCSECRSDPPPFDAARAAGIYESSLRLAIHRFKYDGVRAFARPLGAFVAESVVLPFELDCLCPVPLHQARSRMRGYNQSLLLAEELGRQWNLPVDAEMLIRMLDTDPQMQLPLEKRKQNVKGAFTASDRVRGRTIGLVDDVYTTGSTLRECSRVLKQAGAERVCVVTIARAVRPGLAYEAPQLTNAASSSRV